MKSKLRIIIANEVKTDVMAKSFWITTFLIPVLLAVFGICVGFLMADSDSLMKMSEGMNAGPSADEMTPLKALAMMLGIFPVIFLMIYGAMVFNKVKTEKGNRIVEILATCVDGRTMMLAKIISVGIVGLFQLLIWMAMIVVFAVLLMLVSGHGLPWNYLLNPTLWMAFVWSFLYFIGGYIFYASLFAAVGAMTDKNNENQGYVTLLTMLLLASFYIGEYAVDHAGGGLAMACSFIPFTAPTLLTVISASKEAPLWLSLCGLASLFLFAGGAVVLSGKIYTSSILLRGKKIGLREIGTMLKTR
ncbi:MAG: ABC transporter permease [Muribaculaceae bacterium]|nr:ABC transporter permease [Muribaculaceae bacterium]